MKIAAAFAEVAELALALGAREINKLPGCWEHAIDERWRVAVNAHPEERETERGAKVPPLSMYVEFNGWPAGVFTAGGGWVAAGSVANEAAFIEAVRAAREKVTP